MATAEIQQAAVTWPAIAPLLFVPHTPVEYERLVATLDNLIDVVGDDESHPLASLMEVIGVLIERYEDEHVSEISESVD